MSIKLCVITPISHLQTFASLGEMDMVLSHLVLPNGGDNAYTNFYRKQKEKGRFILLDNSLFECEAQGVGVGIDACLDAAEIIQPNEVIAEDVLFDGPATIQSTREFINRMKERGVLGKYKVMGVVQGRNKDEWLTCLNRLMDMPEINTIGLSKLSVPMSFMGTKEESGCVAQSRVECVETIAQCYGHLNEYDPEAISLGGKRFHLLGGDNWLPWEIKQQTQYPWIRSNDSSAAVWYGRYGRVFDATGKIDSVIMEKPDLENQNHNTECMLNEFGIQCKVMQNIVYWHMAAKGE